jgi:hypothetical protein
MASDPDAVQGPEQAKPKLSIETRIALIGVLGALAGTVVGGLITWAIANTQIQAQRQDAQLAERRVAYSTYFGDAAQLWTQVQVVGARHPHPTSLSASEAGALNALEERLTKEYALLVLLAPANVHAAASNLNQQDTAVQNVLLGKPIMWADYDVVYEKATGGTDNLLVQFIDAAKKDLGVSGG